LSQEMLNTLFLPELREMLAAEDAEELTAFTEALHPARTADFMEGLTADESWAVLRYASPGERAEIFGYLPEEKQLEILETQPRDEVAELIGEMPPDDRVDLLNQADTELVEEVLPLVPAEERRDILRLSAFPEGTAGAVMTTEFAKLAESLTVREALTEITHQAEELETIYYIFVVDDENHLRGIVSARQLLASLARPETKLGEMMERHVVSVNVMDDQEAVAHKVAKYDLLAIPVVDDAQHMLGIITHDDVIDVVREEATEDAHRAGAVDPLEQSYLSTGILTLSWKRGIWLAILFIAAMLTALAIQHYEEGFSRWEWLILFVPLIISSGGNTGSQSATLIIAALTSGDITIRDWWKVVSRELAMGLVLGGALGLAGALAAWLITEQINDLRTVMVVPLTLLLVVLSGALLGSLLPLIFKRLGFDPALMSNPFVAAIIDILGIVIYMTVATTLLV